MMRKVSAKKVEGEREGSHSENKKGRELGGKRHYAAKKFEWKRESKGVRLFDAMNPKHLFQFEPTPSSNDRRVPSRCTTGA